MDSKPTIQTGVACISLWISIVTVATHHDIVNGTAYMMDSSEKGFCNVIQRLRWTTVAVIQDKDFDYFLPPSVQQIVYRVDNASRPRVLQEVHDAMFPNINMVVLLETEMMFSLMDMINNYDVLRNHTTDFRHHAKLVVQAGSVIDVQLLEDKVQDLENVVVILDWDDDECLRRMYTLHIHPERTVFSKLPSIRVFNSDIFTTVFPNTQYGYNQRTVTVSTLPNREFSKRLKNNGTVTYDGYVFDIWRSVAAALNLSYTITEPDDRSWGIELENGTWNGFIQQLRTKKVDVVVADLTISYARAQHVDYIYPAILVEIPDILYRKEPKYGNSFLRLTKPLTGNVYVTLVMVLIGMVTLITISAHCSSIVNNRPHKTLNTSVLTTVPDIITDLLGSALRQGIRCDAVLKTNPGKILLASWCLLMLVMAAAYTANLVASLSTARELGKISSIEELIDSDYMIGIFNGSATYDYVRQSKRPLTQTLFKKMVDLNETYDDIFTSNTSHMARRVSDGHYAYVTFRSHGDEMANKSSLLDMIGESITWAQEELAFAVVKDSPLKVDIENVMRTLKEQGMFEIWWKKRTHNRSAVCDAKRGVRPISVTDVSGGLIFTCAGIALSSVILLAESMYKVCRK